MSLRAGVRLCSFAECVVVFFPSVILAHPVLLSLFSSGNQFFNGEDELVINVCDEGHTGAGGPKNATVFIPIAVVSKIFLLLIFPSVVTVVVL